MSITKSYNKQTGIYYAYETTYKWSDEKQKKVQHKRCIGQFNPETGEVVPNGKIGRPSLANQKAQNRETSHAGPDDASRKGYCDGAGQLLPKLTELEGKARILLDEIHGLISEISASSNQNI